MTPVRFIVAGLILLLAGCGDSGPDLKPLEKDALILAFGDSLTFGTGANAERSYPAVLSRLSGHRVINAGVPGEVTAEGLKRLPGLLDAYQPALVIVLHGGNDLLRKLPPQLIEDNLSAMISLVRQQQAQVVLISVPRPALLLSAEPLFVRLAESRQVPLENDVLADILQSRANKSDAVHPNEQGYAQLAEGIFQFLKMRHAL